MKKPTTYLLGFIVSLPLLAHAGDWIEDQDGCKHWNPNPAPNESVTWTGDCKAGYASGYGEFQWFKNDVPSDKYIGHKEAGKNHGKGKEIDTTGTVEATYINGDISRNDIVTIFLNTPKGAQRIVKITSTLNTLENKTDGWIERTDVNGKTEKVYRMDGVNYKSKADAEATQAFANQMFTGMMKEMFSPGSSCTESCKTIRNDEQENCKSIFSGGEDLTACMKEVIDDYGTCKTDCRRKSL